jgi:hypothetical protein
MCSSYIFFEVGMDIEKAKANLKMAKAQQGWAEHYRDEAKYWDREDMREKYYRKERESSEWARAIYQAIKEAGYTIEEIEKLIQEENANSTNS